MARPTRPICHGITANELPHAMAFAMRFAASPASRMKGIGYGFTSVIGVLMYPGQMVTTRTPLPRNSTRRLSKYEIAAALEAEYAPAPGTN